MNRFLSKNRSMKHKRGLESPIYSNDSVHTTIQHECYEIRCRINRPCDTFFPFSTHKWSYDKNNRPKSPIYFQF